MVKKRLMLVAGEASGDAHAAGLVRALNSAAAEYDLEFFGAAGPKMREAGVDAVVRADELSIVGILEIARALPMFWQTYRCLKNAAKERKPDIAVLVDFPDFNLKLARTLKKQGIKVVYFISPQLWAWRKYRVRTIRKYVDLVLAILPFEKEWYAKQGVENVKYVGNPSVKEVHSTLPKAEFCNKHGLDPGRPIIALLPGSRQKEISRIIPILLETANLLFERRPELQFTVALSKEKHLKEFERHRKSLSLLNQVPRVQMVPVVGETYDALATSDVAAVTSGTATLEAGILNTPMAIVYKTSAINYKLLRPLIDVPHFGLINLIAGERLAKELIQDEFTPESLADELEHLLKPEVNASVRMKLSATVDKLGHGGALKRAASAILEFLEQKNGLANSNARV
jgi:lipid-A-disaccharide synthase